VAYQSLKNGSTENMGFIIPVSVVQKFLLAWRRMSTSPTIRATRVAAFGHGRFVTQKLESKYMRRAYGMSENESGMLVKSVDPTTPNARVLQVGDVILELDGITIGNDGCVPFGCGATSYDRVPFPFVAIKKFVGDTLEAKVRRDTIIFTCTIQLCVDAPLVPFEKEAPWLLDYVIIGGLVFVVLSKQYLRATFGEKWRKERCSGLSEIIESGLRDFADEQVVVLSYVLAHTVNLGFQDIRNARLKSFIVDGSPVRVRNLCHLAEMVECSREPFLRFELFPRGSSLSATFIVLDRTAVKTAEPELLKRNRIPESQHLKYILALPKYVPKEAPVGSLSRDT